MADGKISMLQGRPRRSGWRSGFLGHHLVSGPLDATRAIRATSSGDLERHGGLAGKGDAAVYTTCARRFSGGTSDFRTPGGPGPARHALMCTRANQSKAVKSAVGAGRARGTQRMRRRVFAFSFPKRALWAVQCQGAIAFPVQMAIDVLASTNRQRFLVGWR